MSSERHDQLFLKALKQGRLRSLPFLKLAGLDTRIPSLERVKKAAPPKGESSIGLRDVQVKHIIGTENRSEDFTLGFYPKKRWQQNRWTTVLSLLELDRIPEPLRLLEYGGYYFVRDGHHRVSVAKTTGIEFFTAEITKLSIPVRLPDNFSYRKLPLLKAKYRFHLRTGIFSCLDENEFRVNRPVTWELLEKEILVYNRAWFTRKHGREPASMEELLTSWYRNLYRNIMDHIRKHSLLYLFPGEKETDVFIRFIVFWNSHNDPDKLWVKEAYDRFSRMARKRRFALAPFQLAGRQLQSFFRTLEDEKEEFGRITQVHELCPDFSLPEESKRLYAFLSQQIFHDHARVLKIRFRRAPYIQELTSHWYDTFFRRVHDFYLENGGKDSFERFYIRFSRKSYRKVVHGCKSVEAALACYRDSDRYRVKHSGKC